MQMKKVKEPLKISIPLIRLKKTIVDSVVKRKEEYIIINDQKDQKEFVPKFEAGNEMNKEERKRVINPIPTSAVTESHAHLLLNLSNSIPCQKEHPPDLQPPAHNPKQKPSNIHLITKSPQRPEIIVLDADDDVQNTNYLHNEIIQRAECKTFKPPVPKPLQRAKYGATESQTKTPLNKDGAGFSRKDKESQTDKIHVVSNVDYELIKNMIKDKDLAMRQLSRMPGAQDQPSKVDERPEDDNNNSSAQSNLQTPLIDLCLDEKEYIKLDDDTYNRLVKESLQYKVVAAKLFEAMRHYDAEKFTLHPTDVAKQFDENALQGPKVTICDRCRCTSRASCLDKITQTGDHENSSPSHVRIHQVPVSPVSGKLTEAQDQMINHYNLPTAQPTNYSNPYPGALMMSALELPEHRQQFQHWKNTYACEGVSGMGQQQCYIANVAAATSALPSQAASHPDPTQLSSGTVHQSSITQPSRTATVGRWPTDDSLRTQRAPRRLKTTPTRNAPYQVTGPRLPAPQPNKYQILMEQQKLRIMLEKQKEWESHLQNYPNTAWGKSYTANNNTEIRCAKY